MDKKENLTEEARREADAIEKMLIVAEVDCVMSNCVDENTAVQLKRYFSRDYETELRGSCLSNYSQEYQNKPYHLQIKKHKLS